MTYLSGGYELGVMIFMIRAKNFATARLENRFNEMIEKNLLIHNSCTILVHRI